ncbi:DUF4382 domain-containing protein [Massilia yuzhufengensis]|uniref:DUF4382 domain-containing protein n=1 Tax=Massilia yuzhufengensis TaxID=1164594 RepID=A0A1I1MZ99_9BURK|nr:DUF4382 domain-containing protein [Massilia yuzhufengensis]SFC90416.1 protein of unknown function [Massilia yuzhufengensis]
MHHHFARYLGLAASTTAATLMLTACGGGGDDDTQPAPANATRGTLAVSLMTDAPACGFDAVNVTVSKLRFRQDFNTDPAATGWTELTLAPARRINLLNPASLLTGATTDLGEVALPTGTYTQMAVVLDGGANTVRLAGAAADLPLETASAVASGIRVPIDLKVDDGQKLKLVFDFNACESIQLRGATHVLKPRPRPLPDVAAGIGGFIETAALASNVVVTAQKGGTILATTVPHPSTGEFVLPRLQRDSYDVVVQANGRATAVIGAVPVGATGFTSVATPASPIRLATSAVSTISGQVTYVAPAVAPADGTWIMASQSITADPLLGTPATTVTNRLQPVDLATGNYALPNLARASIQYAPYKAGQPLALANAATSGGNGRYRIEALATGYINKTGTSANINVSSGNAPGVNISMP